MNRRMLEEKSMKLPRPSQSMRWRAVCAALYACVVPQIAHAQVDREMQTLLKRGVTWFQGIAMGLCVIAVIKAGLAFVDEEKAPHAWNRMKLTVFGCAIVFSAVGLVQFIKGQFSMQVF